MNNNIFTPLTFRFKYLLPLLFMTSFFPAFIQATGDDLLQWHSTNLQLLRGFDYALGSEKRVIMTFEHVSGWAFGDFYIFSDYTWPDGGDASYYVEPLLRLSLSKLTGKKVSYGIIKDVLISGQIEKPEGQNARKLLGFSVDLNLTGFKYFKSNFFVRDNPNLTGDTYQVTLAWSRAFQIGGVKLVVEGFADLAGSEGTTVSHQLIVPRFLMDLGQLTGMQENKIWLGLEWQYWHNKFGVSGVTESVPQFQFKYVF
jgi:nucleoside-specific outer membrane channel protein Tsx